MARKNKAKRAPVPVAAQPPPEPQVVVKEYPKWLPDHQVIVQTAEEHRALLDGRADIHVVKSAQGDTRTVVPKKEA